MVVGFKPFIKCEAGQVAANPATTRVEVVVRRGAERTLAARNRINENVELIEIGFLVAGKHHEQAATLDFHVGRIKLTAR